MDQNNKDSTTEPNNQPLVTDQKDSPPPEVSPAEQPVITPQFNTDKSGQPKTKKKKLIFAGIIATVFILLAGVGGAAYYVYYLPNTPENVVRQALANELSQNRLEDSVKISGELSIQNGKSTTANITFNLIKDKSSGVVLNAQAFGVTAELLTKDGKTIYVKVGGLNGLDKLFEKYGTNLPIEQYDGMLESLAPLLTKLNNQWYQIDGGLLGSNTELQKSLSGDLGLSQEDLDKIVDIYLDNEFIIVDKKGQTAEINGQSATEYQLHIDGQKLVSFAEELKAANINGLTITQENIDQLKEFVAQNNPNQYSFSVWIDENKNIVQINYSNQKDSTKVDLKLTFSERGVDPKIEAPKNAKNVFELLGDVEPLLQNSMLGSGGL